MGDLLLCVLIDFVEGKNYYLVIVVKMICDMNVFIIYWNLNNIFSKSEYLGICCNGFKSRGMIFDEVKFEFCK